MRAAINAAQTVQANTSTASETGGDGLAPSPGTSTSALPWSAPTTVAPPVTTASTTAMIAAVPKDEHAVSDHTLALIGAGTAILNVGLMAAYVIYTIRTFREIKKQTDDQREALACVVAEVIEGSPPGAQLRIDAAIERVHQTWKVLLAANAPDALKRNEATYLQLTLRNLGRSDIVSWSITLSAKVEPGPRLTVGEARTHTWKVDSGGSAHIVQAGGVAEVTLLVALVAYFPQALFTWTLNYTDTHGKTYTRFVGDKQKDTTNAFALAKPSPVAPHVAVAE